jgi:hypothetical protein
MMLAHVHMASVLFFNPVFSEKCSVELQLVMLLVL